MDPILIAGGGVAGLTLAAIFAQHGIEHAVLEQAPELRVAGAGLLLQPNAMSMMDRLGFGDDARQVGWTATAGALLRDDGVVLQELDLDWSPRAVALHRADLMELLIARGPTVHTSSRVVGVRSQQEAIEVELESGSTLRGSCLLACDGLYSRVRALLYGDEPPRFAGYIAWRGVCESALHDQLLEVSGPGRRFGIVPIGGGRTYWFAVLNGRPDDVNLGLGDVRSRFAEFASGVPDLLAATPDSEILASAVYDRPPLNHWVSDNAVFVGDAAHPMTPDLGQGAGQAIEDAAVLGSLIVEHGPTAEVFARYERARATRANKIVQQSRRMGRIAQIESPMLRSMRDLAFRLTPKSAVRRGMAWLMEPTKVG